MADSTLLVCAPLAVEARQVRHTVSPHPVVHTGYGHRRSIAAAARLSRRRYDRLAVTGTCGSVSPDVRSGDVVVATEIRGPGGVIPCPAATLLATALRRRGLTVHRGPIVSTDHIVLGGERARLAGQGALAVDMESAGLAVAAAGRPFAVARVVVDSPADPLVSPRTLRRGQRALAQLPLIGAALREWAAATSVREVQLAAPRSFCAGVERAIDIVERALASRGAPVYVRKQIVHNAHVVADLEQRGAVFVDELDQVPPEATVVFSAHGVAPAVRTEAADRGLQVIDATCPLVTKVHNEAKRFSSYGQTLVLIGHAGHEEVVGTLGEAPENTVLVETEADVAALQVPDPERVAYLMQTTLSVEESRGIVAALRARFPAMRSPRMDDICYATTNRQQALAEVAATSDTVLVVGSANSSNSLRLVELAQRQGVPAHLVDDVEHVDPQWLAGVRTVGISAGASAPPALVDELVSVLSGLGDVRVSEHTSTTEDVHFTLPKEVS